MIFFYIPFEFCSYRDLSDMNNDGKLTREGFAVAMCLIKARLAGAELPQILPSSLAQPTSKPLQTDLLLDDVFSTPSIPPQSTGAIMVNNTPAPSASMF